MTAHLQRTLDDLRAPAASFGKYSSSLKQMHPTPMYSLYDTDLMHASPPNTQLTAVVRVLYIYSSLLNVADEAHKHRLRREEIWLSRGATPTWEGSFEGTLRDFRKADVGPKELQLLLNRMEYSPVFTAHPTEARRREILTTLHRIFYMCERREDQRLSPAQKDKVEQEIEAEVRG
jgi:phosphoenolpyruvate carboxylase